MTHWWRNKFSVVPAQAGTHNHEWSLLNDAGMTSPINNNRHGVWVLAFARTTEETSRPVRYPVSIGNSASFAHSPIEPS
jgi:hypothetical protein